MATVRKTTAQEKQVFTFLNDLRDSGVTNMFGAAPYIQNECGIGREESIQLLKTWMKVFNREGKYDEIATD